LHHLFVLHEHKQLNSAVIITYYRIFPFGMVIVIPYYGRHSKRRNHHEKRKNGGICGVGGCCHFVCRRSGCTWRGWSRRRTGSRNQASETGRKLRSKLHVHSNSGNTTVAEQVRREQRHDPSGSRTGHNEKTRSGRRHRQRNETHGRHRLRFSVKIR
jgi:hypothetical protein